MLRRKEPRPDNKKHPMKKSALTIFAILIATFLQAQNDSYQKVFDSPYQYTFGTVVDDSNRVSLLLSDDVASFDLFYLEHFNPDAALHNATIIESEGAHDFKPIMQEVELHNEQELICKYRISFQGFGLFYINFETSEYWDVGLEPLTQGSASLALSMDENGNTYLYSSLGNNTSGFRRFKISKYGDVIDAKRYYFDLPEMTLEMIASIYDKTNSSNVSIFQSFPEGSILVNIDTLGTLLQSKLFADVYLHEIISDGEGGFFVIGKTALISDFTGNEEDLVLMKLDAEFNIISAQAFYADNFDYKRSTIKLLPDGSIAMAYSTSGAFPVILSKLDINGNILWEKGYPLYEPEIDVTSDGALLLTSSWNFDEQGDLFRQIVLSKTDTLGNITNCEVFPTCLNKTEVNLSTSELTHTQYGNMIPVLTLNPLVFGDTTVQSNASCNIPSPPNPQFDLTDTLCAYDFIELSNLANRYAHGITWKVSGVDMDTTWQDSTNFSFAFEQSGDYIVEQTIWFLGCPYSHLQQIYIIDYPEISIDIASGSECDGPPLRLAVSSNQMIDYIDWQEGGDSTSHLVTQSGWQYVSVSNGYCETTDSIFIDFVIDSIEPPLSLPDDTTLCHEDLPFALSPQSLYTSEFILNGDSNTTFDLFDAGIYEVQMTLGDCIYTDSFQLEVKEECTLDIFIPNVFSPNGDGNNDYYQALGGNSIEITRMQIFNRWGGVMYDSRQVPIRWDGRTAGKDAQVGVYLVLIEYRNVHSGEVFQESGELTLLR